MNAGGLVLCCLVIVVGSVVEGSPEDASCEARLRVHEERLAKALRQAATVAEGNEGNVLDVPGNQQIKRLLAPRGPAMRKPEGVNSCETAKAVLSFCTSHFGRHEACREAKRKSLAVCRGHLDHDLPLIQLGEIGGNGTDSGDNETASSGNETETCAELRKEHFLHGYNAAAKRFSSTADPVASTAKNGTAEVKEKNEKLNQALKDKEEALKEKAEAVANMSQRENCSKAEDDSKAEDEPAEAKETAGDRDEDKALSQPGDLPKRVEWQKDAEEKQGCPYRRVKVCDFPYEQGDCQPMVEWPDKACKGRFSLSGRFAPKKCNGKIMRRKGKQVTTDQICMVNVTDGTPLHDGTLSVPRSADATVWRFVTNTIGMMLRGVQIGFGRFICPALCKGFGKDTGSLDSCEDLYLPSKGWNSYKLSPRHWTNFLRVDENGQKCPDIDFEAKLFGKSAYQDFAKRGLKTVPRVFEGRTKGKNKGKGCIDKDSALPKDKDVEGVHRRTLRSVEEMLGERKQHAMSKGKRSRRVSPVSNTTAYKTLGEALGTKASFLGGLIKNNPLTGGLAKMGIPIAVKTCYKIFRLIADKFGIIGLKRAVDAVEQAGFLPPALIGFMDSDFVALTRNMASWMLLFSGQITRDWSVCFNKDMMPSGRNFCRTFDTIFSPMHLSVVQSELYWKPKEEDKETRSHNAGTATLTCARRAGSLGDALAACDAPRLPDGIKFVAIKCKRMPKRVFKWYGDPAKHFSQTFAEPDEQSNRVFTSGVDCEIQIPGESVRLDPAECAAEGIWIYNQCSTCCCKGGQTVEAGFSSKLIKATGGKCGPWFEGMDWFIGAVTNWMMKADSIAQWSSRCMHA